ncbi:MAG: EAL domain-containing protein [Candidatus Wenzhouxiangella sp. M2_3B_020]
MNLYRLSMISMVACILGLAVLLAVTVRSAQQMNEKQAAIGELLDLEERIDTFSSASDGILVLGADSGLWQAYLAEARSLRSELMRLGEDHPDALKAAHRVQVLVEAIGAAAAVPGTEPETTGRATDIEPLDAPIRTRIVMQQVANQGIALDTALDDALAERQRAIAREANWLGAGLAISALLFGALCVVAFGLIHRRMALPTRTLADTLESIRAGETEARAKVAGNDELSRLAQTLNTLLDEREAADRQIDQRQRRLESALSELHQARERLERAQRIGDIGSWEIDYERGRQLDCSDQAYEILGVEPERFGGTVEDFLQMVHPDEREWLRRKREEWLEEGGQFEAEYRIVRPDGEIRWVVARAQMVTDSEGAPSYSTGTLQDITDRRRQETRVRELQELVEGTEDLCGIVDDNYRYCWVNQAYLDRYGLSRDELEGRSMEEVLGETYFQQEIKPRVDRCLAGNAQRFETKRSYEGLGTRTLLARYYPIDGPGAAHRRAGAVITDVTAIREAESEVASQAHLLEIAGRAGRFGGWSIDLESQTVDWSDVTAEIHSMPHGYSPTVEEGIDFYAPEYRDRIRELFTACAERGRSYDEELQIVDAEGRRRWVRAVGEPVRDDDGRIEKVQGAFQDITEAKEAELESRRLSNRLAALLDSITDGFVAFDKDWRYVYVNDEAAHMLGKSSDELLGTTLFSQFPDIAGTSSEAALRRAMDDRVSDSAEEFFEPLGAWFEMRAYPWEDGVAAYFRDVSESHRMVETLQQQEADLRESRDELNAALATRQTLINSLPAHIALLDADGVVIDVNDQWRHFGEKNEFEDPGFGVGSNYIRVCERASGDCAEEAEAAAEGLREVLSGEREIFTLEYPCHAPDEQRWFRVMFNRLAADTSLEDGAVAMHVDVTERKLAERQLEKLAYEDPLTGLASRSGFTGRLRAHLDESGWNSDGIVVMLDVKNQRDINDAHGYEFGDRLLVELARRIRDLCGEQGLPGRADSDQFIIYFVPDPSESTVDALRGLRHRLAQPVELEGTTIEIGLWIGFTALGTRERDPEDLIREAELAKFEHRATSGGEGDWVGYTRELDQQTQERIQLTGELQQALDHEQFELHFQPKVDLDDGRVISAEALLRWHHPERGLQPPGLFMPVAERSQLIAPIGHWVLRDACRQLRDWRAEGLDIVWVSVNVSMVQFSLGGFPAKVQAALDDYGIDPAELSLEITESVFERQSGALLAELRELREMGVRLSLDDFGTGYSSLLYLQRYPFDEIKIDRAFVSGLLDDEFSRHIVRTVIDIAGAIDAEVVAEGVESPEIIAALREMGVRIGQGFYYSVPLESEDFRWLLRKRRKLPLEANEDSE